MKGLVSTIYVRPQNSMNPARACKSGFANRLLTIRLLSSTTAWQKAGRWVPKL